MKMSKKILAMVICALLMAMPLFNAAAEETAETKKITFTYWGSTYEKESIESVLATFTEETGIEVEGIHIPDSYETKLMAMVAAGEAPDLANLAIPTAYTWYEDGVICSYNDILEGDETFDKEKYLDTALVYYDDTTILGILTAIEGTAIFYNKDLFEQAGVVAPSSLEDTWTWEEFLEAAQKLTIDDQGRNALDPDFDKDNIVQYGCRWSLGHVTLDALAKNNGASYIAGDGTTGWTSPEMVEVVQKVSDLINVYHVMPTKTTSSALPSAQISLETGRYAMTMEGQWLLNTLAASETLNVGIAPVPSFGKNDKMVIGSSELAIFADSENKSEAWLLAKYLTDPSKAIRLYNDGLWMPIMKNWYTDETLVDQWASVSKARPEGYRALMLDPVRDNSIYLSELYVKNFNRIWDVLGPTLDNLWNGEETDAEVVLKSIEDDLNELTVGTYGIMK